MTGPIAWSVNPNWQAQMMPNIINALQTLGDEMVEEMKDLAPKGTRDYEGPRLEDTIYAKVIQPRGANGRFGQAELEVGADADYALDVEFGHHTVDGNGFVEAQPFIRPVVYKHHDFKSAISLGGNSNFVGNPPIADSEGGMAE